MSFEIGYGRAPPSLASFVLGETGMEALSWELMTRNEALIQLKFPLERAQGHG